VRSAQLASSAGPGSGERGAGEPARLFLNLLLGETHWWGWSWAHILAWNA